MEYSVGDKVFLKISPWKGIVRFGNYRKLSSHFIGPYEIVERIRPVAYRLALPLELSQVHDVFHVSILKKYRSDPSHVLKQQPIELREDLSYAEELVRILAREEKVLKNKVIPLVKVLWCSNLTSPYFLLFLSFFLSFFFFFFLPPFSFLFSLHLHHQFFFLFSLYFKDLNNN